MQRRSSPTKICFIACLLWGWLGACSDKRGTFRQEIETDASVVDGGNHTEDSAISADSGTHVIKVGDTYLCLYDNDDRLMFSERVKRDVLTSATTSRGFGVVFARSDDALFVSAIDRLGEPQAPVAVVAASAHASTPTLLSSGLSFVLAYRTESSLITRDLTQPASAPSKLSTLLPPAADGGGAPWALAGNDKGMFATWFEGDDKNAELFAQALTSSGAPSGERSMLPAREGRASAQLALVRLQDGSLVVAWREANAVFGQRTSAGLSALGPAVELSKTPVAGNFAFSARTDSAGLLYPALDGGARKALKLRRIADDGTPDGPILNLADAPRIVQDGSITPFGRGYALVYRELPSMNSDHTAIRIAFVNPFGEVVYDAELAKTNMTSAATSVTAGDDERLLVSYIDESAEGPRVHALRISCPGALVLCGGTLE